MTPFTRTGAWAAIGAVVLYAAGVLLGYPALIGLAVGLTSALCCAAVAVSVKSRVSLRRTVSPLRVTVGQAALGRVEAHNPSRWRSPALTAVDRIGSIRIDLPVRSLSGGESRVVEYPVPTTRRGLLRLGPLTLLRVDAFGLLSRAQRQTDNALLWVHPRVHALRPLPVGIVLDYEGPVTENSRPGTVTFSSLREYAPGDDPRRIHWKSSARTGNLMVREHVDTTEPATTVVLDTRESVFGDEAFEHAVEVAASVASSAWTAARPVVLHVLAEDAAALADAGAHTDLDRLAAVSRCADRSAVDLVRLVEDTAPGGALVVVTGEDASAVLTRLAGQRRRFTTVVVAVIAPGACGVRRRPGLVVLSAPTAEETAAEWNRFVGGS
ncbi:DUF58 domain-containing protein [Actinosynnema sp. NPDC047251]|uniref:Putative membrane protein n=1 Tax=Saccharothrix espanaensis (strain ATCC 51144 / DSM 44229 / JCM 9112 / NBRC 15066 / NRRL 15764) TaxID=1179773 RepID=K0K6X2_SACES|nr:DUF58 domain-containing protein [Saccharothrix espanaensis]CCH32629.1 putative membrane protein [Saccharothrix espanaensis DSM 44229]